MNNCFIYGEFNVVQDDIAQVLAFVKEDLINAVQWAITSMYADEDSPDRIYMRDINGSAMSILSDPCQAFGLNTIIRPENFQRLKNLGR